MIGYFKERNSFQVPALLFVTILLKLIYIYHPQPYSNANPGGLLAPWLEHSFFAGLRPAFTTLLSIIIIFFSGLFANYLLASCRMFSRNNLLVGLSFLLFTSLFPATNYFGVTTLLLPVLILLFQQITRLYNSQKPKPIIINIGLIMGAGYLLYHPFAWIIPCCFFGLAGMRAFRITEWLLLVLGFITPVYFVLSYDFLTDHWDPMRHLAYWKFYTHLPRPGTFWWISLSIAGIWILAGVISWQQQIRRMLIQSRKNWYQLINLGIFILPMGLFPAGNLNEALTLFAFPACSFAANAFANQQRNLSGILLFWLIVSGIVIANYSFMFSVAGK